MTKVLFSVTRCDGPLFFDISGHAEYENPDNGNNDVCVAISAITIMLCRYMQEEYMIQPTICEDGHLRYDIEESSMRIGEVFRAAYSGLKAISELYPGTIKIY